jgi:orotidine-5'-phosphate decarboxylase
VSRWRLAVSRGTGERVPAPRLPGSLAPRLRRRPAGRCGKEDPQVLRVPAPRLPVVHSQNAFLLLVPLPCAMNIKTGIVLALDVTDHARAVNVAAATAPHIDAVKVGYPLVLGAGLGIVTELARSAYVLCDFKVADIPNTNRLIAAEAFKAGARGIICQAFPGRDSVAAVVEEAGKHGGDVFVVTEMSHPGALDFLASNAEAMAKLAAAAGAAGIIAPATRPERVRALRGLIGKLQILSPGVGAQGGKASDAIAAGADAVIVGRSIYDSPEPGRSAEALADEVRQARK